MDSSLEISILLFSSREPLIFKTPVKSQAREVCSASKHCLLQSATQQQKQGLREESNGEGGAVVCGQIE